MEFEFWNVSYLFGKYCTTRIQTSKELWLFDSLTLLLASSWSLLFIVHWTFCSPISVTSHNYNCKIFCITVGNSNNRVYGSESYVKKRGTNVRLHTLILATVCTIDRLDLARLSSTSGCSASLQKFSIISGVSMQLALEKSSAHSISRRPTSRRFSVDSSGDCWCCLLSCSSFEEVVGGGGLPGVTKGKSSAQSDSR